MKSWQKITLIAIVAAEIFIIITLTTRIIASRSLTSPGGTITPLSTLDFPYSDQEGLEFFMEPEPNTIDESERWLPFKAKYTINQDSLNDLTDYSLVKPDDTYRIIALGDSYTYGLYVDTYHNWTEQLERLLNSTCDKYQKYEVINLAVPAYDLHYSLERFRIRGQKYQSDLVVWFIKDDDFTQLNKLQFPLNKKYYDEMMASGEHQRQVTLGNLYPSWDRADQEIRSLYSEDQILAEQKKYLEAFLSENDALTLLLTFSVTDDKYKNIMKSYHDGERVKYSDVVPNIFTVAEQRFDNDGHPTIKGHQAIAENLSNYLDKSYALCR